MAEGNTFFGGYKSFGDMFDGGGAGYSGDQFMHGGGAGMDSNGDNRVSSDEYSANPGIAQHNFFSNFSNGVGATPSGSGLAPSGVGGFVNNGGIMGQFVNPLGTGEAYSKGEYVDGVWKPYDDARGHPGVISEIMKLVYGRPTVPGNPQPGMAQAGSTLATQSAARPTGSDAGKPEHLTEDLIPLNLRDFMSAAVRSQPELNPIAVSEIAKTSPPVLAAASGNLGRGDLYGNLPSYHPQTADDGYFSDTDMANGNRPMMGILRNDGLIDYTKEPSFITYMKQKRRSEREFNKPPASLEKLNSLFNMRIRGIS